MTRLLARVCGPNVRIDEPEIDFGLVGVGEIVDFRAVPWGWGKVVEAPTAQQLKANPEAFNVLNRSAQLLPILSRLGARDAETPPLHFECQHGEG